MAVSFYQIQGQRFGRCRQESTVAHPVIVEHFAQVTCAVVVKNHHHNISFFKPVCHLHQSGHGRAGAVPHKNAFFAWNTACHYRCIFVGYLFEIINDAEIHIGRQKIFSNAFCDIRIDFVFIENACFLVLFENRAIGINSQHLNGWIFLFQIPARTANGTAGSHTYHQMGDFTFGLFPNFRTGLFIVSLRIAQVIILIGLPGIWNFFGQTCTYTVVTAGIFGLNICGANDDFGAKRFQSIYFFLALLVGGGKNALVSLDNSRNCQTHARIAAGSLHNSSTRFQQS